MVCEEHCVRAHPHLVSGPAGPRPAAQSSSAQALQALSGDSVDLRGQPWPRPSPRGSQPQSSCSPTSPAAGLGRSVFPFLPPPQLAESPLQSPPPVPPPSPVEKQRLITPVTPLPLPVCPKPHSHGGDGGSV